MPKKIPEKMPEMNQQCDSWLMKGRRRLQEAEIYLKQDRYSESVSASQECIEFSVKAIFSFFNVEFTKEHKIREQKFKEVYNKIPQECKEKYNYPRIYLLSNFWSEFYIEAKYGFEILKIGSDKIFEKGEADLALQHAYETKEASWAVIT